MTTVIDSLGDPVAGKEFPAVVTNRCSDFDLSEMTDAMNCGSPLSAPCFDFSRCRDGPTVYVYDEEVKPWEVYFLLRSIYCQRVHGSVCMWSLKQGQRPLGICLDASR